MAFSWSRMLPLRGTNARNGESRRTLSLDRPFLPSRERSEPARERGSYGPPLSILLSCPRHSLPRVPARRDQQSPAPRAKGNDFLRSPLGRNLAPRGTRLYDAHAPSRPPDRGQWLDHGPERREVDSTGADVSSALYLSSAPLFPLFRDPTCIRFIEVRDLRRDSTSRRVHGRYPYHP